MQKLFLSAKGKQKYGGESCAAICALHLYDEMTGGPFSIRVIDENCIQVISEKA